MNRTMLISAMRSVEVDGVMIPFAELESRTFICDNCGERHLIYDNSTELANGEVICDDCLNNEYFLCEHCHEWHHNDSYRSVRVSWSYTEDWCEDCVYDHAYTCEDCGCYVAENYATDIGHGNSYMVCDNCLEDYRYCDECESYVRYDDYDFDREMCYDCARRGSGSHSNAVVRAYHDHPTMQWFGVPNVLSNTAYAGYGLELEIDRDDFVPAEQSALLDALCELCGDRLYFEHDGSLHNGFEIIIQPHTPDAFDEIPWEDILRLCREHGYSSHDAGTCGLHMHFSRELFGEDTDEQDENITKLMQFFEFYWDDIVKVSRRAENQLGWCGKKGTVSKKRLKEHVKSRRGGHYEAVNNSNRNTVEIRVMRGTLDYESFKACTDFMRTIVDNACKLEDVSDDTDMLEGVSRETLAYLSRRGAFSHAVERMIYR